MKSLQLNPVEVELTMHNAEGSRALLLDVLRTAVAHPGGTSVEIDLTAVTDIDACGCQLLALFLENLKREGVTARTSGLGPEAAEKVRALGFDGLICVPGKEGA